MNWQIYLADNRAHLLQLKEIGEDNSICFTFWYDSSIDACKFWPWSTNYEFATLVSGCYTMKVYNSWSFLSHIRYTCNKVHQLCIRCTFPISFDNVWNGFCEIFPTFNLLFLFGKFYATHRPHSCLIRWQWCAADVW